MQHIKNYHWNINKALKSQSFFLVLNLLFFMAPAVSCAHSFEENWQKMQEVYEAINTNSSELLNQKLIHIRWRKYIKKIRENLQGSANKRILLIPEILHTMVRTDNGKAQAYEINFLRNKINKKTKDLITIINDVSFSEIPLEITQFNCTKNTLGQLYIAAKIIDFLDENKKNQPKSIIEFGGGYGNLARIFKQLFPQATYVIIDLPELLALQYLYINETSPLTNIVVHNTSIQKLTPQAINLVPINFIDNPNLKGDCFISASALSETTQTTQKKVVNSFFFGTDFCFITGQIDGWRKNGYDLEPETTILNGVKMTYKNTYTDKERQKSILETFGVSVYEVIGWNNS